MSYSDVMPFKTPVTRKKRSQVTQVTITTISFVKI